VKSSEKLYLNVYRTEILLNMENILSNQLHGLESFLRSRPGMQEFPNHLCTLSFSVTQTQFPVFTRQMPFRSVHFLYTYQNRIIPLAYWFILTQLSMQTDAILVAANSVLWARLYIHLDQSSLSPGFRLLARLSFGSVSPPTVS
jgi:hypothetical protein